MHILQLLFIPIQWTDSQIKLHHNESDFCAHFLRAFFVPISCYDFYFENQCIFNTIIWLCSFTRYNCYLITLIPCECNYNIKHVFNKICNKTEKHYCNSFFCMKLTFKFRNGINWAFGTIKNQFTDKPRAFDCCYAKNMMYKKCFLNFLYHSRYVFKHDFIKIFV